MGKPSAAKNRSLNRVLVDDFLVGLGIARLVIDAGAIAIDILAEPLDEAPHNVRYVSHRLDVMQSAFPGQAADFRTAAARRRFGSSRLDAATALHRLASRPPNRRLRGQGSNL